MDSNEGDFQISKIGNVFACSRTTSAAMDKRRPRLDSAHRTGPETHSLRILIIVDGLKRR